MNALFESVVLFILEMRKNSIRVIFYVHYISLRKYLHVTIALAAGR